MLSREQYEAIGRLAIGFNDIEYVIERYLYWFLEAKEFEVAARVVDRQKFFQYKKELLLDFIQALEGQYPVLRDNAASGSLLVSQMG